VPRLDPPLSISCYPSRSGGVNPSTDRANLTPIFLKLLIIAGCVIFAACTKPPRPNATDSLPASPGELQTKAPTNEQPKPETTPARQPPTVAEAKDALERVYRGAVVAGEPATFVTGDFNGDDLEDIAIVVTPVSGMIAEINSEFANWILADPKRAAVFDPKKRAQSLPETGPVKVQAGEVLLAIVHGHGPNGWRDRDATQSYLLKNSAATGMRVFPLKNFPPALKVKERGAKSRADVISGTISRKAGFLYWATGKYAWQEQ
jgi:hypothetical protein